MKSGVKRSIDQIHFFCLHLATRTFKEVIMTQVLELMILLDKLKQTARDGWNREFPSGSKFKTRKVKDAESVADHSWGLAMFAFVMGHKLGLDVLRIVLMALVHDIAELITDDINTAILEPEERDRKEQEKKTLEEAAMHRIFDPMGEWGRLCYELWLDYATQASPEARLLRQLDRLEASIQAHVYHRQGQQVDPQEFFAYTRSALEAPELIALMGEVERVFR
jgi:putative hydrolase of HD superfamily